MNQSLMRNSKKFPIFLSYNSLMLNKGTNRVLILASIKIKFDMLDANKLTTV